MKIHAFKVRPFNDTVPLSDVLGMIEQDEDLGSRIMEIRGSEMRLEEVRRRNGLWFLDFVKIRTDHGPGHVGRNAPVKGFEFEEDEGFGEETSALYDPETNYILIEYNHHGVRAAGIQDYLSEYDVAANNVYEFVPKLDEDVERKLRDQAITRKLAFTLELGRMSAADRREGRALADAITYGRNAGAEKMKIEISVSRDNRAGLGEQARQTVDSILNVLGRNPGAVSRLEVTGKEDNHAAPEVLDLLGHRLVAVFDNLQTGEDLRYPRRERWRALVRARNGWIRVLR